MDKFLRINIILIMFSLFVFGVLYSRPRIGLVLSGGSARGLAHIGVLKELDSLNVPIDYISGTSIGAIIATFYAMGYSPSEIENILSSIKWNDIAGDNTSRSSKYFFEKQVDDIKAWKFYFSGMRLKIPNGMIYGRNIITFLSKYLMQFNYIYDGDFNKLPIPLRITATDLVSGKQIIFDKGNIVDCLRASMGFPPIFVPYKYENMRLVDGGVLNNLPTNTLNNADILIAVDASEKLAGKKDFSNPLDVVNTALTVMMTNNIRIDTNKVILITPQVSKFSGTDFSNYNNIIQAGILATQKVKSKLKLLAVKKNGFDYKNKTVKIIGWRKLSNSLKEFFIRKKVNFSNKKEITVAANQFITTHCDTVCYVDEIKGVGTDNIAIKYEFAKLDSVIIKGNKITNNDVIFRELTIKKGDLIKKSVIQNDVKTIYATGLFKLVAYELKKISGKNILIFTIDEEDRGRIITGLSYDTNVRSTAYLRIGYNNLFGRNYSIFSEFLFGKKFVTNLGLTVDRISDTYFTFYSKFSYSLGGILKYDSSRRLFTYLDKDESMKALIGFGEQSYEKLGRLIFSYDFEKHFWFFRNDKWRNYMFNKFALSIDLDSRDNMPFPVNGIYRHIEFAYYSLLNGKGKFGYIKEKGEFFLTFRRFTFNVRHIIQITKGDFPPSEFFANKWRDITGYLTDEIYSKEVNAIQISGRVLLQKYVNDPRNGLYFLGFVNNFSSKPIKEIEDGIDILYKKYNMRYGFSLILDTKIGIINFTIAKDDWKNNYFYFFIGQYF